MAAVVALLALIALPANAEPAMWVVRDEDSTIYLLGTIHILPPETQWENDKINQALKESTELWLEVANIDEIASLKLLQKYGIDRKKKLTRRLNSAQRERLEKVAETYSFPMALLDQMKPWYAAVTLTLLPIFKAGYNPNAGVEQVLEVRARLEGDKIRSFETAEEQIQLLAGLSEADQIALLEETLNEVEEGIARLNELVRAWSTGETEAFQRLFLEEMKRQSLSLYQNVVVARNVRWSRKVSAMLKGSGVQMIAVGAGHLVGPDSVQAQLQTRGVAVERY